MSHRDGAVPIFVAEMTLAAGHPDQAPTRSLQQSDHPSGYPCVFVGTRTEKSNLAKGLRNPAMFVSYIH
jgi:hypothetical protein